MLKTLCKQNAATIWAKFNEIEAIATGLNSWASF